jgi:protein MpaA
VVPSAGALDPLDAEAFPTDTEIEIGRSVQGRPITVIRRGTPGGTRVLAVGVIHGNEAAGVAIIDRLAVDPVPDGVELWLVRSMNPDGEAIGDRQNANRVDLNRNFPENWDVLGAPGDWQYGGTAPASEPETQAMVALGAAVRPDLILWYHQDLFRIAPGSGRPGEIRTRYAELTALPVVDITGGTYTGTASQWSRTVIRPEGVGITVELGPTLSAAEVDAHVRAVHTVAREFW